MEMAPDEIVVRYRQAKKRRAAEYPCTTERLLRR
jgi:hypothetical protein